MNCVHAYYCYSDTFGDQLLVIGVVVVVVRAGARVGVCTIYYYFSY